MSDLKLFKTDSNQVSELKGSSVVLEKSLQTLIENNLEIFLGVKFLASEFVTSNGHRMDTLGIDENGSPVIIEYKRATNENIINQGLFYLDWLMDHKRDFEWLVLERFGKVQAKNVDWGTPRLICIAGDFTKYDSHAVNQMKRNIELIRYRRFGNGLLLLELLTSVLITPRQSQLSLQTAAPEDGASSEEALKIKSKKKTISQYLIGADLELSDLYETIKAYLLALGDDVQIKILDHYIAFRKLKNFVCVEVKPQICHIKLFLKISPETIPLEDGFTRDVRKIGHFGTGDLEIIIKNKTDFDRAKPLIERSYDES
jgi:predicted transport protein